MRPLTEAHAGAHAEVHVVVPAGIDDPELVSGGNAYDRRVIDGLRASGWAVTEHPVTGAWPRPDAAALERLAAVITAVPSRALLLVDGLVASCAADVLVPSTDRLCLVVLVHLPLGLADPVAAQQERRLLTAASAVITTSAWTREVLLDAYGLEPESVHVARPGVDPAPSTDGSHEGTRLLCVAAVTALKGHADLVAALTLVADLSWSCVVAGSLERDPDLVADLRDQLTVAGLADRVRLVGTLRGADLEQAYAAADLLVLPSHVETYGMVVTEAIAHGVPVVVTAVGGVAEALAGPDGVPQDGSGGGPAGLLVPPGSPGALAEALRCWLDDADLRERLRHGARRRRRELSPWPRTAEEVSAVLVGVRDA